MNHSLSHLALTKSVWLSWLIIKNDSKKCWWNEWLIWFKIFIKPFYFIDCVDLSMVMIDIVVISGMGWIDEPYQWDEYITYIREM